MISNCACTIRKFALAAFLIAVAYGIRVSYNIPCPYLHFFHIPCPGCGMTHAVIAAIHFDFGSAFVYHPMFWSLPVIGVLIVTDGRPTRYQVVNLAVMLLVAGGFLASYILRLSVYISV